MCEFIYLWKNVVEQQSNVLISEPRPQCLPQWYLRLELPEDDIVLSVEAMTIIPTPRRRRTRRLYMMANQIAAQLNKITACCVKQKLFLHVYAIRSTRIKRATFWSASVRESTLEARHGARRDAHRDAHAYPNCACPPNHSFTRAESVALFLYIHIFMHARATAILY